MNILIVRTDRIGDVILTLPVAVELKKKYSAAKIYFLSRRYTKEIPELCKSIDEVICLEDFKYFELRKLLIAKRIDLAVMVYPRFSLALLLFLSKIKLRIGTKNRWYSFLFNKKVNIHRKKSTKHELEYNLDLLQPLDIQSNVTKNNVDYNIHLEDNLIQSFTERIRLLGINEKDELIIMHIGSGNSSVDWKKQNFVDLAYKLAQNLMFKIILTGSEQEKNMIHNLFTKKENNIFNFAGKFSIKELYLLIKMAKVYIGNSTGPTHISGMAGTDTFAFYPKVLHCSALRWGPYTKNCVVFSPTIDCKNCTIEQCEKLQCMESISVDSVYNEIIKKLN